MTRLQMYRRLFGYLRPYWLRTTIAYVTVFFATSLNLLVPQIVKRAIDDGLATESLNLIIGSAVMIVGLSLVRGVNEFFRLYYGLYLSFTVAYDFRNAFYEKVQSLPFTFHDTAHTGDLMSRATSDISQTERFIGEGMVNLAATLILLIGVVIAMFIENAGLALIALIPLPVLLFATIRFGNLVMPQFREIQDQMGILATMMQESLTGISVVKAFAREHHELQKFDTENSAWFDKRFNLIQTWANNWPFFSLLLGISVMLILWFGGPIALEERMSIGTLFAMISYVLLLNGPVQRLGFLVNRAATAGAAAQRVFDILDLPNETEDNPDAIELSETDAHIQFEGVSFSYSESKQVLDDISFEVKPGQTVALIGPTGSGKSTVINLLPRFYNVTAGTIRVDGHDVQTLTKQSLRQHFGTVLQDPFLFSLSIGENIAYGRPGASDEAIQAAARAARAEEFIERMPAGYETRVGERGVTLSGGQKQRIAIARALLADPKILILDDSTSSVDTETEHLIQQALDTLMEGRTTLVIAQRLLTLKNADMILVLDHGRIVERGKHDALLAKNGLYREIYDLQLKDQEEFMALMQEQS